MTAIGPFLVDEKRPLQLASASPRRRELLEAVGVPLVVRSFDVDETRAIGEEVDGYLERVASAKLRAALDGVAPREIVRAVLAADTVVVVDGVALGKPTDPTDAARMLASLSGRAHEVRTRFAIGVVEREGDPGRQVMARTVTTLVHFRELTDRAILDYVATGECTDKAGAYAIQGIGGFAVERIEGSYSNVVGLPVCEVIQALEQHGIVEQFPLGKRATA